jgi:hypothetical protein
MKQKLYSLYDNVAEQFGPIFQAANNNTAARSVQNMKIRAWQDFELYLVGEWDMEGGLLTTGNKVIVEWVTPAYKDEMKIAQMELLK